MLRMKIKVIDLLVKMGKDKNYKPTFKYKNAIYQYDFKTKYYTPSFMGLYKIYMILNQLLIHRINHIFLNQPILLSYFIKSFLIRS